MQKYFMRWIALLIFLGNFCYGVPEVEFKNSCVPLENFSNFQKEVLLKSYLAGEKDGFGYTLAAIAWKESCAGVYKMNFQDPSAGNYHAYIPGVINRYPQLKQNGFTQNLVGAMLVEDDNFAAEIAISELKYWQKTHNGDWKKIIKSYNKGYSWEKNTQADIQAENYYRDVAQKVRQLQDYFQSTAFKKVALEFPKKIYQESLGQKQLSNDNPQADLKRKEVQEKILYAKNPQKEESFLLLPIYQVGTEFAAPMDKKPTIIKEFDLIEVY